MTLKDLAIEHAYYCSDSNFYSRDPAANWDTWVEFYEEFEDADVDMNLVFRWDVHEYTKSKGVFSMDVYFMHQRKGIFAPHHIRIVRSEDYDTVKKFLDKHWEHLKSIWEPIS